MATRLIKESIWTSPNLNQLSDLAEVFFYRLICYADDFGRFDATPAIVKGRLFPRRPTVTDEDIENWLSELVACEIIEAYRFDGIDYAQFKNWEKHQRVRNKRSKIPPPDGSEEPINDYYRRRFIPAQLRLDIYKRDKNCCLNCKARQSVTNPLSIDHIVAVKNGGESVPNNLQTLCFLCNMRKATKTIDYRENLASRRELPPIDAESGLNPNPNPNSNPNPLNGFDEFWKEYPKKKNRGDAEKAWKALNPNSELQLRIMAGLHAAKKSQEWSKDGGQYIPYPASWLRAKGWEDEHPKTIVDPKTGIVKVNPVYRDEVPPAPYLPPPIHDPPKQPAEVRQQIMRELGVEATRKPQ